MTRREFANYWTWTFDRYGMPITILSLMLFAMWRFAEWSAPIADRVATKHVQFLESTEETQRVLAGAVNQLAKDHADTKELVRDIHQAVIGDRPIAERRPEHAGQERPIDQ